MYNIFYFIYTNIDIKYDFKIKKRDSFESLFFYGFVELLVIFSLFQLVNL